SACSADLFDALIEKQRLTTIAEPYCENQANFSDQVIAAPLKRPPHGEHARSFEHSRSDGSRLLIRRGLAALDRAEKLGGALGPYALRLFCDSQSCGRASARHSGSESQLLGELEVSHVCVRAGDLTRGWLAVV